MLSPLPFGPADVHWVDFGGREPLPDSSHLYGRADQAVQREEDWGITAAHIRHWR